jgi:L-lactate dehydrogenase complex protein LldG
MSRNKILQAIKANKPAPLPLPDLFVESGGQGSLALFQERLAAAGGSPGWVRNELEAIKIIREKFPEAREIAGCLQELNTVELASLEDPHKLESLDLAIFRGSFAVAENGAVWLEESECRHRVAPFIPQHLVLLVSVKELYANMHEAYCAINGNAYGYGVFIAGPSKTADIEQSLVIGAHGPKSLLVLLMEEGAE